VVKLKQKKKEKIAVVKEAEIKPRKCLGYGC